MRLEQVLPQARVVDASQLAAELREAVWTRRPRPFDPAVLDLFAEWSARLLRDPRARRYPELTALAFWMRRSELRRLQEAFESLGRTASPQPRGLVFHLPPGNVDTIFVYSWLLSALTGNHNVLRVSSRAAEQGHVLLEVLGDLLSDPTNELVRSTTTFVRYGHDPRITAALSAVCDVRVIWGGDAAIAAVRAVPLPPHAIEFTFADRDSLAVLGAAVYLGSTEEERDEAARRLTNDAYWFDQAACSSPRAVVWVGAEAVAKAASEDLFERVAAQVEAAGYEVDTGTALAKQLALHQLALDAPIRSHRWHHNALVVVRAESPVFARRGHPHGGLFVESRVDTLEDLAPFLQRRDQTLVHFGLSMDALRGLVEALRGRGVDRLVPLGEALAFERFWDGLDLLQAFTRRVTLRGAT